MELGEQMAHNLLQLEQHSHNQNAPREKKFEFIDDEPPSPPKGPVASSNNRIVVSQNQDTKKK